MHFPFAMFISNAPVKAIVIELPILRVLRHSSLNVRMSANAAKLPLSMVDVASDLACTYI